jgi:N-acetylmuramoyl-L-alanine amidase
LNTRLSQRGLCWGALLLLVTIPAVPTHARARRGHGHSESWARERYTSAERMREALNGRPPVERTRRDYQRVVDAYRSVYYGAPNSTKADPSAVAVAETMVEMGRRFDDDAILEKAIAQYKFVRREYPGSKYRCDALFTIGEIYKDDLNDPEQARAVFQDFLKRYPRNRLAEDAEEAVAEIDREAKAEKKQANKKSARLADKDGSAVDTNAKGPSSRAEASASHPATNETSEPQEKLLPRVTGIHHWSTPDYTRVAIDVESEVKFWSQRIPRPERIFFDLRDTKLASTLVGKSFDVDDGFLKKIRVAQFKPGRTRVVLEVDNLSDYDAFLLPNPYRLIIDIHGKDSKNARRKQPRETEMKEAAAMTADVEVPPKATSRKADSDSAEAAAPAESADSKADTTAPDQGSQDLRAAAGKAPVTRRDVNDDTKIQPRDVVGKDGLPDLPRQVDTKREKPAPTKVIVDNDDEEDGDNSPVESAPSSRSRSKSSSRVATTRKSRDSDAREAKPTAGGDRSLIRALGLKIGKIVIDPGHGGHDTGTIGPNGLKEKDLVLEVGRRLGKMLDSRLGAEVVYTRKNDTFIPLETRTAIANQQRADLFISIHANSSRDPDARGVETYYLNFTSSPEALEVAARENAVSEKSIYELQDLVKKIALKEKIEESREFAGDVQEALHSGLALKSPAIRNRGVKKAPFIVLIGANMPSILAEISFVSNPSDEHRLETGEYRQRIAESLYRGIAKYADGLSGVRMASKMDKAAGQ